MSLTREQQIIQIVSSLLGERPLALERMTFGHNSQTFEVILPGRSIIVRTNEQAKTFARTVHNLEILGRLGLPVPKVIATDLNHAPFAWMILEKIPGRDLGYELPTMSRSQMSRLAEQIIGFQQRVATLPPGRGFGYVAINDPAPFSTWFDLFQYETHLNEVAPIPELVEPLGRLRHLIAHPFNPYLTQIQPICFLDDITVKNVIIQTGELQGLVDFDCVCYGDPLFTIALTATGIVCDLDWPSLFYVQELSRLAHLSLQQQQVTALYAALFALDFVRTMSANHSSKWTKHMTYAIKHWVLAAESPAALPWQMGDLN